MGEPYVQFFVDAATGKSMANSARYVQHPRLAPAELFMTVAVDSARKVVVRKLWNEAPLVCGTARWDGGALVDRQQNVPLPWDELALHVRDQVGMAAAIREAEREAYDDGVVGALPAAVAKRRTGTPLWKNVTTWIAIGVFVAIAAVAMHFWNRYASKYDRGNVPNGEKCSRDSQCASGWCKLSVCRAKSALVNGARCEHDDDCSSGRCSRRTNACVSKDARD